jgi:hypothetical protein
MDRTERHYLASASARAVIPIAGLLGGLFLGGLLGTSGTADEFAQIYAVIKWGVTGFFLGLALILLFSLSLGRKDIVSTRRLMVLVVIVAVVTWYAVKILFSLIGSYGS